MATDFDFPIFKTKIDGVNQKFALEDPVGRRKYFDLKAGSEIEKIRDYLQKGNTFVGFLLGPKNSGKGTYTKLFMEAVGGDRVAHISVGDIVRSAQRAGRDESQRKELVRFLQTRYRGFTKVDDIIASVVDWNISNLLETEGILALVEWEVGRLRRKAIFIDGFPRNIDQISLSLYFRSLMGYRDDPDFFVYINVPESVIDERIKYRVICPHCQSPRNTKLLRTKDVGYDKEKKEFYLICDNPNCEGFGKARLVGKAGDSQGIEAMRDRIELDKKVIKKLLDLQGVSKVYLRNTVPVTQAKDFVDDYEITPGYRYELEEGGNVKVIEEPWTIKDDAGEDSYSLLPAPVAVALIKQTAQVLGL